ncbi:MAG: hypothetical protein NC433_07670 [Clostridiales bacterium]|nr:hypothetical protein [Clostridiales bacterium]
MSTLKNKSSASAEKNKKQTPNKTPKRKNVDWHKATSCALQIDLRGYSHLLKFESESILKDGDYRIDLLLVKKTADVAIQKNIAKIFSTFNLFEIKGLGSSVNTDCYYKTIGYAGFLIEQQGKTNEFLNTDISLSFPCIHYPRELIKHLTKSRKLTIEKSAPGVYHINKEIFNAQIIVIRELSPDDSLYLRCLTNKLTDTGLIRRLAENYQAHHEQNPVIYTQYLSQLIIANSTEKGGNPMVCEELLNLYGTSSEEITEKAMAKAEAYYQPKIDELSSANNALTAENEKQSSTINNLSSTINYLQNLLMQHNIPFNFEA